MLRKYKKTFHSTSQIRFFVNLKIMELNNFDMLEINSENCLAGNVCVCGGGGGGTNGI